MLETDLIKVDQINSRSGTVWAIVRDPTTEEAKKVIVRAERISKQARLRCGHAEGEGRVFADNGSTAETVAHAFGHLLAAAHGAQQEFTTRTETPKLFQISLLREEIPISEESVAKVISGINW